MHIPVLLKEVLEYLDPKSGQNFIDATVGNGGHAEAILEKTAPNGKLIAIDRDPDSIIRAKSNLANFNDRVLFINDSFGNINEITRSSGIKIIHGAMFDFGMSSDQLENSGRGFSFQRDEILDMRFDPKNPVTAEDLINGYSENELADIFRKWGEEPMAGQIAKAVVLQRRIKKIKTTRELRKIIESAKRQRGRINPATRVFQALRVEVNQEFSEIERALIDLPDILAAGGRIAFISFHSLEDRLIKKWSIDLGRKGIIKILTKKPVVPAFAEKKSNPRSRSAKLRVIEIL